MSEEKFEKLRDLARKEFGVEVVRSKNRRVSKKCLDAM